MIAVRSFVRIVMTILFIFFFSSFFGIATNSHIQKNASAYFQAPKLME